MYAFLFIAKNNANFVFKRVNRFRFIFYFLLLKGRTGSLGKYVSWLEGHAKVNAAL